MKSTHIALLEDDEILSKVLKEELTDAGFAVSHASDGEVGLKMIQNERPALILLDVLMPKKTGFEVLHELKNSPATRDIPVIMLTMLGQDEDIKKGFQLGANDYFVKSQHAVAEICDKVKEFFSKESHPEAARPKNMLDEAKEKQGE
jgi:two-component system, sensor histidine kinase ChiS